MLVDGSNIIPHDWGNCSRALSNVLRALIAAQEDKQSDRSRADPQFAHHQKHSINAHIQRLIQQFLRVLVHAIAMDSFYNNYSTDKVGIELRSVAFSKDFIARVRERVQKLAQKNGRIDRW